MLRTDLYKLSIKLMDKLKNEGKDPATGADGFLYATDILWPEIETLRKNNKELLYQWFYFMNRIGNIRDSEKSIADLEKEENECLKLIDERDFREDQINQIADLLGDDREWTSQNDRGENCLESIEILNTKLADIERKLEIAVEALEFECGNRCSDLNPCNAKEVLREIKE
jgi:hypothetical protein